MFAKLPTFSGFSKKASNQSKIPKHIFQIGKVHLSYEICRAISWTQINPEYDTSFLTTQR